MAGARSAEYLLPVARQTAPIAYLCPAEPSAAGGELGRVLLEMGVLGEHRAPLEATLVGGVLCAPGPRVVEWGLELDEALVYAGPDVVSLPLETSPRCARCRGGALSTDPRTAGVRCLRCGAWLPGSSVRWPASSFVRFTGRAPRVSPALQSALEQRLGLGLLSLALAGSAHG